MGLAASLVTIAVAGVVAVVMMRAPTSDFPSAPSAPSTVTVMIQPPVTSTMTAAPLPPPPPPPPVSTPPATPAPTTAPSSAAPTLSHADQLFLTEIEDIGISYPSSDYAITHAHATCDFMINHHVYSGSSETGNYVAATTVWGSNGPAAMFAMYAANNYCVQHQSD